MSDHDRPMPAFSPGAADLLRELIARGLRDDAVPAAAALTIALDRGVRGRATSSTSASTSRGSANSADAGDELARLLDELGAS